jgi:hypothetical protein
MPIRAPSRAQRVPRHKMPRSRPREVLIPSRSVESVRFADIRGYYARAHGQCRTLGPARRALRCCESGDVKNFALCENDLNVREPRPTIPLDEHELVPTVTLRFSPPVA